MEIGQSACERITEEAMQAIRGAIEEVGGREVFVAGRVGEDRRVYEVRVCARGHESAVPAILEGLKTRDVVIHNHPSGDIAPSEADLELASVFGTHGHGVYIVDNDVNRAYVVVEPFLEQDCETLDVAALAKALAPDGPLAQALTQYEERPQQIEMLESTAKAFNEDGIAIIEAPTGVGKTMAYLLPAAAWAVQNRERVVISTKTINLQEQIMFKDIPVLAASTGQRFNAVLVKGRANYLCRRRLKNAMSESSLFDDEDEEATLKAIWEWSERTEDGSRSDLPFMPSRDLWERICSEGDTCRPTACPHAPTCFLTRARRDVAKADLLVVNHHMLFSDLSIKREMGSFTSLAVLPAYRRVILDEAHSIEDSATEYFGVRVTRFGALLLLGRLIHVDRGQERGVVPFLKRKIMRDRKIARKDQDELLGLIDDHLLPAVAAARQSLTTAFDAIRELTAERCETIGRDVKWRLTQAALDDPSMREIHDVFMVPAAGDASECARWAGRLARRLRDADSRVGKKGEPDYAGDVADLEAYAGRLERLAGGLTGSTQPELEANTVRWVEIDGQKKNVVRLVKCLLDVGTALSEWVYPNLKTVVMTSATLSVQREFGYFLSRAGLDRVEGREVAKSMLDSPFDFGRQAVLCIPSDIADPSDKGFLEEMAECVRETLAITRGHAFVLFTSFYALDYVYRRLREELEAGGIVALKQGAAARTKLLERFRADPTSVLFATDSFWEGVDVAGEALQCVILPKLPFRVPTEPILEARAEAIEAAGGNSFMTYTVPQAVIKFRQGFGRLVRRKTDRGAIVVLDRRVIQKHYGRTFLGSLPGVRVVKGPRAGVYGALRQFFETCREGSDAEGE